MTILDRSYNTCRKLFALVYHGVCLNGLYGTYLSGYFLHASFKPFLKPPQKVGLSLSCSFPKIKWENSLSDINFKFRLAMISKNL